MPNLKIKSVSSFGDVVVEFEDEVNELSFEQKAFLEAYNR